MSSNSCSAPSRYSVKHVGTPLTTSHRVYLTDSDASRILSPFHDVPLRASPASGSAGGNDDSRYIVNMLVEIPRFGNAKMEVSKDEWMNPIKQDIKKGALRYVKNCFPHRGYPWNYGALPQVLCRVRAAYLSPMRACVCRRGKARRLSTSTLASRATTTRSMR